MPVYEYQCDACRKIHEVLQKVSDSLLTHCPECGKDGVQKLFSLGSFALKGSGYYSTDYKKPARTDASGPASNSSSS